MSDDPADYPFRHLVRCEAYPKSEPTLFVVETDWGLSDPQYAELYDVLERYGAALFAARTLAGLRNAIEQCDELKALHAARIAMFDPEPVPTVH